MSDRREFIKKILATPTVALAAPALGGGIVTLTDPAPPKFRFDRHEANVIANALSLVPKDEVIEYVELCNNHRRTYTLGSEKCQGFQPGIEELQIRTGKILENGDAIYKRYIYTIDAYGRYGLTVIEHDHMRQANGVLRFDRRQGAIFTTNGPDVPDNYDSSAPYTEGRARLR